MYWLRRAHLSLPIHTSIPNTIPVEPITSSETPPTLTTHCSPRCSLRRGFGASGPEQPDSATASFSKPSDSWPLDNPAASLPSYFPPPLSPYMYKAHSETGLVGTLYLGQCNISGMVNVHCYSVATLLWNIFISKILYSFSFPIIHI